MDRDKNGDCRRKDGKLAGQSWRKRQPPRDIAINMRVDANYEGSVRLMMGKYGIRSLADFHERTYEAWCFLNKEGPLPSWADVGSK